MPGEKKTGQRYKKLTETKRDIRMLKKEIGEVRRKKEMFDRMRKGEPRYIEA